MRTESRKLKDALYEQAARMGKALASGPRLELLDLLGQGPRTVEVLATLVGQSIANTSHHLQVLRRARLVDAEKNGLHVTYRISEDRVASLFVALRGLAQDRLDEIGGLTRELLAGSSAVEPVDRARLLARLREGEVTLVDVRPSEEYRAGHLPGALSIPLPELERRIAELPRGREVVAYCRGPWCVMAVEAVAELRRHGLRALRWEGGVADWRAQGLPVEVNASREEQDP